MASSWLTPPPGTRWRRGGGKETTRKRDLLQTRCRGQCLAGSSAATRAAPGAEDTHRASLGTVAEAPGERLRSGAAAAGADGPPTKVPKKLGKIIVKCSTVKICIFVFFSFEKVWPSNFLKIVFTLSEFVSPCRVYTMNTCLSLLKSGNRNFENIVFKPAYTL